MSPVSALSTVFAACVLVWETGLAAGAGSVDTAQHVARMSAQSGFAVADGELIVKPAPGLQAAQADRLRSTANASVTARIAALGLEVWRVPQADSAQLHRLAAQLTQDPSVLYAEPNYRWSIVGIPNDPDFGRLWGLHNTGATGGTPDADIDAPEGWERAIGSRSVVVAVIDTGIDYTHPDLVDNIWVNDDEVPGNGIDDDGNGYVDDRYGYDFAYRDADPMDRESHGTHCAGTIGAVGGNGIGVVGVAQHVSLMAVKFLNDSGSGWTSDAVDAVVYAVDNGAQVLSNSWGGGGFSTALEEAIDYARQRGVLFVAAAGNSRSDNDRYPHYPSSYEVSNVLAVAATDHNDALSSFSSYGATSVDLGAPGSSIYSTTPGNGYGYKSGTSMATPQVSGAAAVIKSLDPNLDAEDIKQRIMDSVDPLPTLAGITVTGGRLNLDEALRLSEPPEPPAPDCPLCLPSWALGWRAAAGADFGKCNACIPTRGGWRATLGN
jgi:subtilisin family serine protease